MNFISPIIEYPKAIEGCNLFIKREDLIPFSFGGNKCRIGNEFFYDMKKKECNCIIGYGSVRSNMCRIIANIAKSQNIPCHIVSPEDATVKKTDYTNNGQIIKLCGATVHHCKRSQVAETIDSVIHQCTISGLKPYYINGDKYGRGNEKIQVTAYYKVYQEIVGQSHKLGVKFDYFFLPTGTGMTIAGLIAGQMAFHGKAKIVGLSIARDKEKEAAIVENMVDAFFEHTLPFVRNFEIDDTCLCGGYGQYDSEILCTIKEMMINYGLPLDVTYTGKAFAAMKRYIKHNNVHGNILFIHTGGTPLFFDNISLL